MRIASFVTLLAVVPCLYGSSLPEEPTKVSVCQLKNDPASFDNKRVEVTGFCEIVSSGHLIATSTLEPFQLFGDYLKQIDLFFVHLSARGIVMTATTAHYLS